MPPIIRAFHFLLTIALYFGALTLLNQHNPDGFIWFLCGVGCAVASLASREGVRKAIEKEARHARP